MGDAHADVGPADRESNVEASTLSTVDAVNEALTSPPVGAVEEYRSLRAEIASIEHGRLLVLGFAVFVLGGLGGFGARLDPYSSADLRVGVAAVVLGVVLTASLVTNHLTERVEMIREYLARYVEPLLPGAHWEQRQLEFRAALRSRGRVQIDESLGAAVVYLGAVVATLVAYFNSSAPNPSYAYVLLPILAFLALLSSLRVAQAGLKPVGGRMWDVFESVAVFGTLASRPVWRQALDALRPQSRRVARARSRAEDNGPSHARAELALSSNVGAGEGDLQTQSGLSQEEFQPIERSHEEPASTGSPDPVSALEEVVTLLVGGLGPEGMAAWLQIGQPTRLELLQHGRADEVLEEARRYVSFPARSK